MRILLALTTLILSACGNSSGTASLGDGGGTTPTPTPAPATQTIERTADRDATLYESDNGDTANGRGPTLYAGRTQRTNELRRLVLHFDLANLPATGVAAAELSMSATKLRQADNSFTVHRLLQEFSEGPSNAGDSPAGQGTLAQTGDVTWIHRRLDDLTWDMAGGTFASTASAHLTINSQGRFTFESVERGLEQDVELWLTNPAENFGWIVLGDETSSGSATEWAAREAADESQRPELRLTFDQ